MPTYPYNCVKCDLYSEIIKPMSESGRDEKCVDCGCVLDRIWTAPHLTGTKVEDAEYNPGLGKVTKNKRHREEIAKQMGVVEIGNDYKNAEAIGQKFDSERQKKIDKSWDEV